MNTGSNELRHRSDLIFAEDNPGQSTGCNIKGDASRHLGCDSGDCRAFLLVLYTVLPDGLAQATPGCAGKVPDRTLKDYLAAD